MGMTIFDSKNPAGRAGLELGIMSMAIGSTIQDSIEAGIRAADERLERRAAYEYACDLAEARGRADDLGRVAIGAVRQVASLEAEVRRLKTALSQRQAYIDRVRGAR